MKPTASWAATLAIGKPVALEAPRSEHPRVHLDHDPAAAAGVDRELDVGPAGLDPDGPQDGQGVVAHLLVLAVGQGHLGATVTESPVWTPIGSTFSIEQTTTALSARSRMTSSSNSFQPSTDSSIRTRPTGLAVRPSASSRSSSAEYGRCRRPSRRG